MALQLHRSRNWPSEMNNPPDYPIDKDICAQIVHDELFPLRATDDDLVGIEVEMIAAQVTANSFPTVVPFFSAEGKGLRTMLRDLALQEGWPDTYAGDELLSKEALRLDLGEGDSLTFEPGGQIEYSSQPHTDLHKVLNRSRVVQEKLAAHLAHHSIHLLRLGINPWHTLSEIGLQIPKTTYLLLDYHFGHFSPIGRRMMQQACTQQVNLDYGASEDLLAKRYLVCNLLAPYSAAMFATSGVWDRHHMQMQTFRTHVWRELDRTRTGFPALQAIARERSRAACVQAYLDFALQALVVRLGNDKQHSTTFLDWLDVGIKGMRPTVKDFRDHLYTLFPEVRPRGYLELRSIDCQPLIWQPAPVAFYLGIVYHPPHLDRVLDALLPELGRQEEMMHLACHGLARVEANFHQRLHWLTELALAGLEALPPRFRCTGAKNRLQVFFEHFTLKNKTPAADIQMLVKNSDKGYLCPEQLLQLEEKWAALLGQ